MSDGDDDLEIVATATDAVQAALIMGRLAEAGIHCMRRGGGGFRGSLTNACTVCVTMKDLERARAVLKADEGGFDEDELARLSEEAGRENSAEP
jgi:hypothetical protein